MITALVMGLFIGAGAQGAAVASSTDAGFTAQARAAGLSTDKAAALQAKVDDYLVKLRGRGKQVSPNQILDEQSDHRYRSTAVLQGLELVGHASRILFAGLPR
ncbi:hypothetical protein [Streptomyces sp. NPDC002491]